MQNFVSFWSDLFGIVSDFLMSEPMIYFVGIFILIVVASFIKSIIFSSK